MEQEYVLKATGISKRFPGVLALKKVDFELRRGEVHALVGENGAGKSTLMQILGGVYRQDEGSICVNGDELSIHSPTDAQNCGIGMVFQELSLVQELSIAENIYPNRQPKSKLGLIQYGKLNRQAKELMKIFNEEIDPATPVKFLTIAKQQVVEILKALSHNPHILILDEPTSSLTQVETDKLFENIRRLKEQGISIIYISHHMSELFEIADRATVLRDGCVVNTVNVKDIDEDSLVSLMVGRDVSHEYIPRKVNYDKKVFEARRLTHKYKFNDISFDVHEGEILGFAGLIGAGRSEMARCIFGLDKLKDGEMYLEGKRVSPQNPTEAVKLGIAYTSESRKIEGLFLEKTVKDNCISPRLSSFAGKAGFLNEGKMKRFADECIRKFNIATPTSDQLIRNLSGGNQQKVLLSMWLGISPKLLIVDEPTKGVDVGAKAEIYAILRKLADTGIAVVVISSELIEVLSISDRILVMKDGMISGELKNSEASEESIIAYAAGSNEKEA